MITTDQEAGLREEWLSGIATSPETKRLVALEKTIERGQKAFIEVGLALAEIRDSRLYRLEFETFEDYCQSKWNFTRQYVNQIIAGVDAVKSLPPEMETIVSNPGQARVEVVEKAQAKAAQEERPMTARDIREAAKPEPEPQPEPAEPPRVRSGPVITGDDVAIKLARLGAWRKELLVGEILEMADAMQTYDLLVSQLSTLAGEMK